MNRRTVNIPLIPGRGQATGEPCQPVTARCVFADDAKSMGDQKTESFTPF